MVATCNQKLNLYMDKISQNLFFYYNDLFRYIELWKPWRFLYLIYLLMKSYSLFYILFPFICPLHLLSDMKSLEKSVLNCSTLVVSKWRYYLRKLSANNWFKLDIDKERIFDMDICILIQCKPFWWLSPRIPQGCYTNKIRVSIVW